jgi:hypothetical protein
LRCFDPKASCPRGASTVLRMVPRFTGKDEQHRSRGAPLRPSYDTPLSEIVTTGHSRSQNGVLRTPLPVVHAKLQHAKRRWKRLVSVTSAWIAGAFS